MRLHNYKGWDAVKLSKDSFEAFVVPSLGGRIMGFELGGTNLLFVNPQLEGKPNVQPTSAWNGVWQNFGGEKIWPAPQGWAGANEWPGPPEPVLDGGVFAADELTETSVSLTSPVEPVTGLQIKRKISLDEFGGLRIDAAIINRSKTPSKRSVWPVAQTACPDADDDVCQITFPAPRGYKVMHGVVNNPQYSLESENARVAYKYMVGKIGAKSEGGWIACANISSGKIFAAFFDYALEEDYPDGTNVQIWTSGRGSFYSRGTFKTLADDRAANPPYMEIELLSPLKEIAPEQSLDFSYRYAACTAPKGANVKTANSVCAVTERLAAKSADDTVEFSCKFGVFAKGKVLLKSASGKILSGEFSVSPIEGADFSAKVKRVKIEGEQQIFLEYSNNKHTLLIDKVAL